MMTHFRKRLSADIINQVNEAIVMKEVADESQDNQDDDPHDEEEPPEGGSSSNDSTQPNVQPPANKGKLLLDATCTPADIAYPTDLGLLTYLRKKSPTSKRSESGR